MYNIDRFIIHTEDPNVGMGVNTKDDAKQEKIIAYARNEEDREKALSTLRDRGIDTELYEIIVDAEKYDEAQAEHEKRAKQQQFANTYYDVTRYGREMIDSVYCDGYGRMHTYTPTKTTIMKGFTQVNGRKHLSKKKRKKLNKSKH